MHNFCEFATDYTELLRTMNDPLKIRQADRIIQFPYLIPVVEEKTEEELARIAEKRREQGRKLQEIAAKTRSEKASFVLYVPSCELAQRSYQQQLVQKENDLAYLLNLRENRGKDGKKDWLVRDIFLESIPPADPPVARAFFTRKG
jgi:actin-related protein 5